MTTTTTTITELAVTTTLDANALENLARLTRTYDYLLGKATGFCGVSVFDGKLVFRGMDGSNEAHKMLVDFIVKFATSAKQVRAEKTLLPNNEKFAFRTWLIRLGWKGRETTKLRTSLYKGLTGNSAFCTEASKLRWLEKHGTKKD